MSIVSFGWRDHNIKNERVRGEDFPLWAISVLLHGRAEIDSRGNKIGLKPQHIYLVRPRTPYHLKHGGGPMPWTEAWAVFRPKNEWKAWLKWPELLPGIGALDLKSHTFRKEILHGFSELTGDVFEESKVHEKLRMNSLERILLLCHHYGIKSKGKRIDSRIHTAVETLRENHAKPLSLKVLAEKVNLSQSRFSHLFKKEMGITPIKYLEKLRTQQSKALLLSTDMSIQEIAREVGVPDPFYFSTCFKREFGTSPTQFRKNPR